MAAIIKLSQNEWVKFFYVQMVGTNLGKCEWVWEENLRWLIPRWPNSRWQNSRWLPSSSWVRMNECESDWISLSQNQSGGRVFLNESAGKNRCLIPTWQKLNPRWQNSQLQNLWWPTLSSGVRMNEFESDWISLSQSQSGGRVFLGVSERR